MTVSPARPALRPAVLLAAALLAVSAGCTTSMMTTAGAPTATARLAPTQGNTARGTATFTQTGAGVSVAVEVSGLKPNQEHGFHVHEKGDCSAPDATSAGGHFNPTAAPHGPQGAPHHGGDMPALKADAGGNARASFTLDGVQLGAGPTSLIGKGVIVHALPDDYTTQPTGNSGARIACGVVGA